jgi:uncharacterized protein YigE (DUF2233 family)
MRLLLVLLAAALFHSSAFAVETKDMTFDGKRYVVCLVDLKKESLELFLKDDAGAYFHHFEKLERALASQKRRLVFGMNAGMFHPGFASVGLFIDHGRLLNPLNLDRGEGNFFLMPNGVFAVTDTGALIVESSRFSPLAA